jgi:Concanavalin A-like lectin/glucanases superfamily
MKMQQLASFAYSHRRLVSLIIGVSTLCVSAVAFAAISSGAFTTASSVQVTTTTLTINKPTTSTGDLMLATIAIHGGSSANISAVPTGWTQIARTDNDAALRLVSYWKIDSASEPSSYQWVIDGQTTAKGGITAYSGVDSSNPIDVPAQGNTGLSSSATTSAITTTSASDTVVAVFAVDEGKSSNSGSYFSPASGMSEKFDVSNTPFGPSISLQEAVQTTPGTFSSKSSSISGGNKPRNWATQMIALKMPPPVPTPAAYWKLDESSGNATDATGNGYTLTNENGLSYSTGLVNNAADFGSNNTNMRLHVGSVMGATPSDPLTISGWVKLNTEVSGPTYMLMEKAFAAPNAVRYLIAYQYNGGSPRLGFARSPGGSGTEGDIFYPVTLGTTNWHYLSLTYDGSTVTAYLDGVSVGTASSSGSGNLDQNSDEFDIGAADGPVQFSSAKIDEVGTWNQALSDSQIAALYNGGAGRAYPF